MIGKKTQNDERQLDMEALGWMRGRLLDTLRQRYACGDGGKARLGEVTLDEAQTLTLSFSKDVRSGVTLFALRSRAHADLTRTHPFLALAIALGFIGRERRAAAEAELTAGRQLAKVARAAGVPTWTRELSAAGCIDPLGPLPDSDRCNRAMLDVVRRIAPYPDRQHQLLRSVAFGYVVAGEEFALWLGANHPLLSGDAAAPRPFRMLALWYLFTILPGTLGNEFVVTPWKREIGIDLALRAAKSFFRRIHVELMVGPKGVRDTWFPSEEFQGFRFVPISTGPLMRAEAARCRNCYDWYGHRIAVNDARLFSMRTADGRVVADIEVGRDETNPRRAAITQMKKPENKEPDPPLRAIGDAWLAAMLRRHGQPDMVRALVQEPDAARWHEIMAPLAAAGLLPEWARTAPTNANLSQFEDEFEKIGPPHSRRGWSYC